MQVNGIDDTILNGYPPKDKQVESEINGNVDPHWDHDMEVLYEDTKPMSAVQVQKYQTKLSIPQRCMGSHFM